MPKGDVRTYYQPDVVEVLDGFPRTLTEADFDDYQRWMSDVMVRHEACLVGAFMGSGKTATTLHAARKLMDRGEITRILIIAPLNVAKDTWPDEIMVWDYARRFTYAVMVGDAATREAALRQDVDIHIINRENLRWLYETVGMRGWKWDCLIYDEASRLAEADKKTKPVKRKDGSVSRKRLSEFGYLTKVRHKFKRVWELSGTPAAKGLIGLWGPAYILDKGERLGTSRSAFRDRWFRYDGYKKTYEPFDHSEAEITERLKGLNFYLKEEDYLTLPPLKRLDRWVTLPPNLMEKYRRFQKTLALEEYDVDAATNGVLCNKLLQFANGSLYAEEDGDGTEEADLTRKVVAKHVHDVKLNELKSVFEEAAGRSVLIAYSFKFDLAAIKKRYPFVRIFGETPSDLQDWNKGKLKAMILHPASAGHGMNFQSGGHIACWYGLNWSLELYQQFNKRLQRRGQEADAVWMYRILARGTMDERVEMRLREKAVDQDRITDEFRVHMSEIREWARAQRAA